MKKTRRNPLVVLKTDRHFNGCHTTRPPLAKMAVAPAKAPIATEESNEESVLVSKESTNDFAEKRELVMQFVRESRTTGMKPLEFKKKMLELLETHFPGCRNTQPYTSKEMNSVFEGYPELASEASIDVSNEVVVTR